MILFRVLYHVYVAENYSRCLSFGENRMIVGLLLLKLYYNVTDRRTNGHD